MLARNFFLPASTATVVLLLLGCPPSQARAQASAAEKAAAEALFDSGLSLMREGEYDQACDKLEQSQAIDRGIGTQLYLAECYAKAGRTASAWALFREAASAAAAQGQKQRAAAGLQRAAELEPLLSRVVVNVAPENTAADLRVQVGQLVLGNELWGVPIPVDPGEIEVVAQATGFEAFRGRFQIPAGAVTSAVQVPRLTPLPGPPPVTSEATQPSSPTPKQDPIQTSDVPGDDGASLRIAGLVTGGVGVVALGVGAAFGLVAISKNGDAKDAGCTKSACPSRQGIELTSDAQSAAALANVFVFGGLAALAAGGLLYLLAPGEEEGLGLDVRPALALDGRSGGLWLGGNF